MSRIPKYKPESSTSKVNKTEVKIIHKTSTLNKTVRVDEFGWWSHTAKPQP